MPEAEQVNRLFSGIAPCYDQANQVLSLGIDRYWRRTLVSKVVDRRPRRVVDLATGSGDVALALSRALGPSVDILGLDFCEPMLEQARAKASRAGVVQNLSFKHGDCLSLPLEDGSVDVLTIAFGLRNLQDRQSGLREMRRVLNPERGCLFVLEFSQPVWWVRPLHTLYLCTLMPLVAALLTRRVRAYQYLAASIGAFPSKDFLAAEFLAAGFPRASYHGITGSVVCIHCGETQLLR